MSASRAVSHPYPFAALVTTFSATFRHDHAAWSTAMLPAVGTDRLNIHFLDSADNDRLTGRLITIDRQANPHGWHPHAVSRHRGLLRHALTHLLRGDGTLDERVDRCRRPGGTYFVPGVGRRFWATVLKQIAPDRPFDVPQVEAGARRVGVWPRHESVEALARVYRSLLADRPELTADQLDGFFVAVGRMVGRELSPAPAPADPIPDVLRAVRTHTPLRRRLTTPTHPLPEAVRALVEANAALAEVELYAAVREPFGSPLATAAVATRPASGLVPLSAVALQGLAAVDDAFLPGLSAADEFTLLREVVAGLRERYRVHPLEANDVLERLAASAEGEEPGGFRGFCSDTFRFLGELAANNSREWMNAHRERYRFAVREPLVELCEAVAGRYVRPVLGGEYGWDIECEAKPGKALTRICKNDYGRSAPYLPEMWLTFYPQATGRAASPQLFVRADSNGVAFGFHLGRQARAAGKRMRAAVQQHGGLLFDALQVGDVPAAVTFTDGTTPTPIRGADDLRTWAAGRVLSAERRLSPDVAGLRSEELVGEVILAFDRLLPLFAAAVEDDPAPLLRRRAGRPTERPRFERADFLTETFLPETWLDRTQGLLKLKRQLVLQGPSGTGKTHVARSLARLLAHDRPDAMRFVQFHPAYSYSEFVESVSPGPDGPAVRDGLLIAFAAQASRHPAETFVLVIDDMTRANLPAVFGELLYLLEYRGQTVTLPFSQRSFRLPPNLYLIATADAPTALAAPLRRRFGFVDMEPDAALLARWFDAHPPADPDPTFGPRVVRLFEQLNQRAARDLGSDRRIGHSAFMVPDLDAAKLRTIWEHHIRPMIAGGPGDRPDRLEGFDLERWLLPPTRPAQPASPA